VSLVEINFDGLIGPSHNYAGLSLGNVASATNAGGVSRPRAAALQGLDKMRTAIALGLTQGLLLPLPRPDADALRALGFGGADDDAVCASAYAADPALFAAMFSASSMWTANAATVSPAPDTTDGRCHLTVANLSTMPHRSIEQRHTEAQLRVAFANPAFSVHTAVPAVFGDEGAANHMRMAPAHDAPGVEIFVYGETGGRFPARQNRRASEAVARLNGLDPARTLFVQQATAAIDAGAFHNDVVAVANGNVLFCHEQAFEAPAEFYAALTAALPGAVIVEVPACAVSLGDAIRSYLFNSQLVSLHDGSMALILPTEAQENAAVKAYLDTLVAGNGPIRAVHFVAVRESMKNGGGPACLRLRVVADPGDVDARFLMTGRRIDKLKAVVSEHWPEAIAPTDLGNPALWRQCRVARAALLKAMGLGELM
jgi:succinylarginine dihydrolase